MFADNEEDVHKSSQEVKVQQDPTSATAELAALERLEKSQWTDNGKTRVATSSFLSCFISFSYHMMS